VDWALILILAGVALAGACAFAAAMAAGGSDRGAEGTSDERAAIWQAGYSALDLRVLAELAALARVDLAADRVEIVLRRGGDGVVATGTRLPPGRLGQAVPLGVGIAGRALAAGETAREGGEAIAAPIPVPDSLAGVVVATAGERAFDAADVARLEALAARTGARLGIRDADLRHAG